MSSLRRLLLRAQEVSSIVGIIVYRNFIKLNYRKTQGYANCKTNNPGNKE